MIGLLVRLVPAFVLAFALDWFTKQWAQQSLVLHEPVSVVGQGVRLTLGYNSG